MANKCWQLTLKCRFRCLWNTMKSCNSDHEIPSQFIVTGSRCPFNVSVFHSNSWYIIVFDGSLWYLVGIFMVYYDLSWSFMIVHGSFRLGTAYFSQLRLCMSVFQVLSSSEDNQFLLTVEKQVLIFKKKLRVYL